MTDQGEEMVSALQEEVLNEMAETFFSARKAVDEEIELFRTRGEELRRNGRRALRRAGWLVEVLTGPDMAAQLWRDLEVPGAFMRLVADGTGDTPHCAPPFAWTRGGRYEKLLLDAYEATWRAFDEYLHGVPTPTPGRPGTVRGLGYRRYRQWAAEINHMVDKVNGNHAPSGVPGVARALDVAGREKVKVADSGMSGYTGVLDAALALSRLDEKLPGLPDLPLLPPPDVAARIVRVLARRVWRERRERAVEVLARAQRVRP